MFDMFHIIYLYLQNNFKVIYEPSDRGKPELEKYVSDLKNMGAHVVETVESGGKWKSKNGIRISGESCKKCFCYIFLPEIINIPHA